MLGSVAACDGQQLARRGATAAPAFEIVEDAAGDSAFARLIERLSEPGGFFDTDNLISNETSYLHVLGKLEQMNVSGGAYIGVGPDQNFSYIAQIRPSVALIIDIRRDNLLQHLMFKALFTLAETRAEYLGMLIGRQPPENLTGDEVDVDPLIEHFDATGVDPEWAAAARSAVQRQAAAFGVSLSSEDLETIGRFHDSFVEQGLGLRFQSFGRPPQPYYPTFRQLILAEDLDGRRGSYLATADAYRAVRQLQLDDRIVPVVGDLAGDHALPAIAALLRERGETVSAFYTSNVEFYLMRGGSFPQYAETVASLPIDERSVIIRSYFGRTGGPHPQSVPGFASTQLLQPIASFAEVQRNGGFRSYRELVTRGALELR